MAGEFDHETARGIHALAGAVDKARDDACRPNSLPQEGAVGTGGTGLGFTSEDHTRPDQEDAWHHRSERMPCANCMYYVPKSPGDSPVQRVVGRCRRHAPTMSGWPVMFPEDWCGDHKLDETKV